MLSLLIKINMFKKSLIVLLMFFSLAFNIQTLNADWNPVSPKVNCFGLPWCVDTVVSEPSTASVEKNTWIVIISSLIWNLIEYVAVFAVIALMLSGVMYLISWWDEEKVKKAKSWIIWSLVWVIISISAWGIINMLNNITIN